MLPQQQQKKDNFLHLTITEDFRLNPKSCVLIKGEAVITMEGCFTAPSMLSKRFLLFLMVTRIQIRIMY